MQARERQLSLGLHTSAPDHPEAGGAWPRGAAGDRTTGHRDRHSTSGRHRIVQQRRLADGVPPSFRTADPYRIFTGKDGFT